MADEELGERCEDLAQQVLRPLVLGGPVHPVRPFGARLGLRLGIEREIVDTGLRSELDVARVRRARLLAPVDALPRLDEGDWATLAAYNDLLQLTNQHLTSPLTRGRYARLCHNLRWLCDRIPAPGSIEAALARHATFARALEVVRTDSTVSWWTGSARFRGETPPSRLLAWKELRRVQVDARRISLSDMTIGLTGISPDEFNEILSLWLTRSPLTDVAEAIRKAPVFAWSASTLSLIATAPGRSLAFRALSRRPADQVKAALARAAQQVPAKYEEARALAASFAEEVAEGMGRLAEDAAEGEAETSKRTGARASARR
jgi:hypothetical protein